MISQGARDWPAAHQTHLHIANRVRVLRKKKKKRKKYMFCRMSLSDYP